MPEPEIVTITLRFDKTLWNAIKLVGRDNDRSANGQLVNIARRDPQIAAKVKELDSRYSDFPPDDDAALPLCAHCGERPCKSERDRYCVECIRTGAFITKE